MNILGHLTVLPRLPSELARLDELARNLYWSWQADARALFRRLDRDLWESAGHNPVRLLRDIPQERLDAAARDPDFLAEYSRVLAGFDEYLGEERWFGREVHEDHLYAYLCAEYGWTEAVALYSGGLGVLAGDHTKAASDLGVPLVAVGLYYPEGYFHQRVATDGRQEAVFMRADSLAVPFRRVVDTNGVPVAVLVRVRGKDVTVQALETQVGRGRVILLDTDVDDNEEPERQLLSRLYGGDQATRVAQEMILGIGGVRMLRALGIDPTAWHMNEGHSAFSVLERCLELVQGGLRFDEARVAVSANTLFTVHTPIAAGNDAFAFDLIDDSFSGYWGGLGLSREEFHALGSFDQGWGPTFSMPALAMRFSSGRNGVAELHGDTSRRIWASLWPDVPLGEVPIEHVTNGVHIPTWLAPEMQDLLDEALPMGWRSRADDPATWGPLLEVPPGRFWEVRRRLKTRSLRFLRRRLRGQLERQSASAGELEASSELFDPAALTIGFARRFATYKRATLIFSDLDRLDRILNQEGRPVQLLFAGKAHPADAEGQELIATIQRLSKDERFNKRILFVEDYDISVGRSLTRGVDVWLNNPRRPLEASGTSGMKAAMNGVLNLSILDGWWPEGYDGSNGWAIGGEGTTDAADAESLYSLLEREVVPLYYDRDDVGVPLEWARRATDAVASVAPRFNATRMVKEYVTRYYAPASKRHEVIAADGFAKARELAAWLNRVHDSWARVYFTAIPAEDHVRWSGEEVEVTAVLNQRDFEGEIAVELVYGAAAEGLSGELERVRLNKVEEYADGGHLYRVKFAPVMTGQIAYGVRAYPVNDLLPSPFDSRAIRWA